MSGIRFGGEEKEADAGGFDDGGGSSGSAVILIDHVLQVFISGDGDERIEVLVRELVLQRKGPSVQERLGEACGEVRE